MRCYHFGNMYLSSIQQGIQAAHAQMELFVKYNPDHPDTKAREDLYYWANDHKTMICLNAGFNSEMQAIKGFLESEENPYPWAAFYESEEAMGGLLTNIALVLPESVYSTDTGTLDIASQHQWMQSPTTEHLTDFDKDLIRMKAQYRMAK